MVAAFWFYIRWAVDRDTLEWIAWSLSIIVMVGLFSALVSYEAKSQYESDSACVDPVLVSLEPSRCRPYSTTYHYRCDSGRPYTTDLMLR